MKKQVFLLSLLGLLFVGQSALGASCDTDCNTDCTKKVTTSNCDKPCPIDHGKTFRRTETTFTNGSPMYVSMFNTNAVRNLDEEDKHGAFEMTVFGGKNTKQNDSACYFMPYGHRTYTVTGEVEPQKFVNVVALSAVTVNDTPTTGDTLIFGPAANEAGAGGIIPADPAAALPTGVTDLTDDINTNPATLQFDPNKDTSIIRPWNFGITFAALFEPIGAGLDTRGGYSAGYGLVTNPEFKSTICPTYHYSHVGAGFALRYHFSDDKQGWFGSISTSVENVKSLIKLNESVVKAKTPLTTDNFNAVDLTAGPRGDIPGTDATTGAGTDLDGNAQTDVPANIITVNSGTASTSSASDVLFGSVRTSYINDGTGDNSGTGFPVEQAGLANNPGNPPENMEQAFLQDAWKYGKMGCEQSETRLADIELTVGYQWLCGDCASANWYAGLVIPTGNKPCAEFVAPAVVGNGQHAGLMMGSQIELLISENENRAVWYRLDTNGRYLFRNTQKRSFDLIGNEWSRYMMVWENEAAWTTAVNEYKSGVTLNDATGLQGFTGFARRSYTPGINVFTHDMKVKPRFHSRMNQAVYFKSDCFRAEMGWNVLARTKECVEFSCPWTQKPAFASPNFLPGVGLNNLRTIYNDSTLSEVNFQVSPGDFGAGLLVGADATPDTDLYAKHAITEADVDLDSAATPSSLVHTPYLTLGYAWDSDYKPVVSVGGSYEFSAGNNRAISQWMVWGKFELAF